MSTQLHHSRLECQDLLSLYFGSTYFSRPPSKAQQYEFPIAWTSVIGTDVIFSGPETRSIFWLEPETRTMGPVLLGVFEIYNTDWLYYQ